MSDKIIWVCCFVLVSVGVILGINMTANNEILAGMASTLDILASLATILAALIAIYTLNSWKKQIKHQARFNAFSQLEQSTRLCFGYLSQHHSLIFLKGLKTLGCGETSTSYDSDLDDLVHLTVKAWREYSYNFDYAISLLDSHADIPTILHKDELNGYIQQTIKKIGDEYEDAVQDNKELSAYSTNDKERLSKMILEIRKLRDR